MRNEQYENASASFRRAIEIGPESARHYWWAANAEVLQGNCTAAIPWLQNGYRRAQADGDNVLTSEFEFLMSGCGLLVVPGVDTSQG